MLSAAEMLHPATNTDSHAIGSAAAMAGLLTSQSLMMALVGAGVLSIDAVLEAIDDVLDTQTQLQDSGGDRKLFQQADRMVRNFAERLVSLRPQAAGG